MLKKQGGKPEYIIEFKLNRTGDSQSVQTSYIKAGLPANGPIITGQMFTLFNAMSDATVVMVIILISLLLIIIAYARTSKTRLLLCFPGREDKHQMLYFSRAASSSYIKDVIAPIYTNDAQWTLCVTRRTPNGQNNPALTL